MCLRQYWSYCRSRCVDKPSCLMLCRNSVSIVTIIIIISYWWETTNDVSMETEPGCISHQLLKQEGSGDRGALGHCGWPLPRTQPRFRLQVYYIRSIDADVFNSVAVRRLSHKPRNAHTQLLARRYLSDKEHDESNGTNTVICRRVLKLSDDDTAAYEKETVITH